MDTPPEESTPVGNGQQSPGPRAAAKEANDASGPIQKVPLPKVECTCRDQKRRTSKSGKAKKKDSLLDSSTEASSSLDDDETDDSMDSSASSSDTDKSWRKLKKLKAARKKAKAKSTTRSKRSKHVSSSESQSETDSAAESEAESEDEELYALKKLLASRMRRARKGRRSRRTADSDGDSSRGPSRAKKQTKAKRGSVLEYKRINHVWDKKTRAFKDTETTEVDNNEFDEYVFTVKRCFNYDGTLRQTVVEIKSDLLRKLLQRVMADVKSVSLVEESPEIDPDLLFLYLEDIRAHVKTTIKQRLATEKKRSKRHTRLKGMYKAGQLLLAYLDEDYARTKKTLFPMLKAGTITFDLVWALFKPNSLVFTTTYSSSEPRCFKVDYVHKQSSMRRGEWWNLEGRYLDYDGKHFGLGTLEVDVDAFKGPRKISSLRCYPLEYHKNPEGLKKDLIERGKRFVALEGMNYRFHDGLVFQKKKNCIAKFNVRGRAMIDPGTFRRINANYPMSAVKRSDDASGDEDESDGDEEDGDEEEDEDDEDNDALAHDKGGKDGVITLGAAYDDSPNQNAELERIHGQADGQQRQSFSDEEYLIASPVVLGFAFGEKLWGEFVVSGIRDIEWDEGTFESLILPESQKEIVKALVEAHRFHAARTIDDIVQGKGKGLVAVLHGQPGTGKTLSAEGCAELMKCPLYSVSAGDLGTNPEDLEKRLQVILDIAHSWGALLLLDEADVFLEQRETHDIHRNAMVSICLRMLEYYQGILFLTTNRVETFDHAFQSRIHIALRYGELTPQSRRKVWKVFLGKVQTKEKSEESPWTEDDYDTLSRKPLNGRQIKNTVRTAQALAISNNEALSMSHLRRVLHVGEMFDQDLRGGTGYGDAMRSYT